MTVGDKGYDLSINGPYGLELYADRVVWNGEDRPLAPLPYPRKVSKRKVLVQKTKRVEGHVQVVTEVRDVPIMEPWSPATKEYWLLRDRPHSFTKSWKKVSHGRIAIGFYLDGLYDHGTGWMTVASAGGLPAGWNVPFSPGDEYTLINNLQKAVQGSDFNAASALGAEGLGTLRLIGDNARMIARSLLAMKKGNVRAALDILRQPGRKKFQGAKVLEQQQLDIYRNLLGADGRKTGSKILAEHWLQYQLGVAPLLGDVKAAAEQLAHRLELPIKRKYTARVKRTSPDAAHGRPDMLVPPFQYGLNWAERTRTVQKQIVFIVKEGQEEPQSLPQLLGLADPEIVLWNALPYSFIADWIIPIGAWLEARGFASGLHGTFVVTTKDESRSTGGKWSNSASAFYEGRLTGDLGYEILGSINRSVSDTLSVALPTFKPLGKVASWSHAATGAALVVQRGRTFLGSD